MISRLLVGAENSNDRVEKGRRRDGLDEYVLKSIFLGLFQHILAAIGGHHHEVRRDREIGQCKNALAGFDAIEPRHLPVNEDDLVRLATFGGLANHFDAFLARGCLVGDEGHVQSACSTEQCERTNCRR